MFKYGKCLVSSIIYSSNLIYLMPRKMKIEPGVCQFEHYSYSKWTRIFLYVIYNYVNSPHKQAEGKGAYLQRCRILQRCRNLQLYRPLQKLQRCKILQRCLWHSVQSPETLRCHCGIVEATGGLCWLMKKIVCAVLMVALIMNYLHVLRIHVCQSYLNLTL